jgi:hypothetical protein
MVEPLRLNRAGRAEVVVVVVEAVVLVVLVELPDVLPPPPPPQATAANAPKIDISAARRLGEWSVSFFMVKPLGQRSLCRMLRSYGVLPRCGIV